MLAEKTNNYLLSLIALLFVGSLININIFGPSTLSAYFFYTIVGALLALFVGVGFMKNKQPIYIANPLPILLFSLSAVYYIVNGLINTQGGINLRHYIILVDAVLFASYCILLNKGSINLLSISKIIVIIIIIESLLCILQQFYIIPSLDSLFKVTGSNVNPNVTAMFLAMALPALFLVLFLGSKKYRIVAISSIVLCVIALVLLQCRTAFIGASVSTAIILNHQYQLLHKLKSKFSKVVLIITAIISIALIALAFTLLYHSKQASSDGRLFIWKLSLQGIEQKPLFGSGYGQFEHDYNLAQANYFATKTATQQEIYNASYVHMGYNEFLENLFEGGIIGLMLFVVLLAVLLLSPIRGEGFFAYAGIASFTIMCIFNFTIQALPVRALFILYAGVCCVMGKPIATTNVSKRFAICLTTLSVFLFIKLVILSKAFNQCKAIVETENDLDDNEALQQMATLKSDLGHSTYYWRGYGNLLFKTKQYDEAIDRFNKALQFTSDPDLYIQLGNCYAKKAMFGDAEQAYSIASNIEPHRFAPKYGLMMLYGYTKDSLKAIREAHEIIALNPKVESKKVHFYKKEARKVISY